jgi:uncharacterized protein YdeI (YjbR/CyaY-like superfamily)
MSSVSSPNAFFMQTPPPVPCIVQIAMVVAKKKPTFFPSSSDFHAWLRAHHDRATELLVGMFKRDSGKPSITWSESVDAALCFGWIDGVRKRIDEASYSIRFTPRRPQSIWSAINTKRAQALIEEGIMQPAGIAAFKRRSEEKSRVYTYEQKNPAKLGRKFERQFRARKKAWHFFRAQAPFYQKMAIGWIMGAKREETRRKRFARLLRDSSQLRRI